MPTLTAANDNTPRAPAAPRAIPALLQAAYATHYARTPREQTLVLTRAAMARSAPTPRPRAVA